MKKLVLKFGALVALLSFSAAAQAPVFIPQVIAMSASTGTETLLQPKDYRQCVAPQPMPAIPSTAPPGSTYLTTDMPPLKYRGDTELTIIFRSVEEVNRICANQKENKPICGIRFYACAVGKTLYMPHPCEYPDTNPYTKLLCHELGHTNGWPKTHGEAK